MKNQTVPRKSADTDSRTKSRKIRRSLCRCVLIPRQFADELQAEFPIDGTEHHNATVTHLKCWALAVETACRCLRNKNGLAEYHVGLAREMRGKTIATRVSRYLKKSSLIDIARGYSAGRKATSYRVSRHLTLTRRQAKHINAKKLPYHHTYGSGLALGLSIDSRPYPGGIALRDCDCVFGTLNTFRNSAALSCECVFRPWCFTDQARVFGGKRVDLVGYRFPADWFMDYAERYREAASKVWPASLQDIRSAIGESLRSILLPDIHLGMIWDLCEADSLADKVDAVKSWSWSWDRFCDLSEPGVSQSNGRTFYTLTNLPKILRRRLSVGNDGWCEVDLCGSYWTILASLANACSAGSRALIADVESGEFYERVNGRLAEPFAESEVKGAVNSGGLFGCVHSKVPFGETEVFQVLSELYPEPMRLVKGYRRKCGGETLLSKDLNRIEGRIFVFNGLLQCHDKGIPVLPIHDCLACSPVDRGRVLAILQQVSSNVLGYVPTFKVEVFNGDGDKIESVQHVGGTAANRFVDA